MSKKGLLKKIEGLILLTDSNIERLRKLIQRTDKKSDLLKIEKFIDQEEAFIGETFKKIFKKAAQGKNPDFLKNLENIIKEAKKDLFKTSLLEEESEKKREEANIESLLYNF